MKRLPFHPAALVLLAAAVVRADLVQRTPVTDARTSAPAVRAMALYAGDPPPAIVLDRSLRPVGEGALLPLDLGKTGLASAMRGLRASAGSREGWTSPLAAHADLPAALPADGIEPVPSEIRRLPPGGDTDALCLSGLLSLGAFQLARRARHMQVGVPAWYHAEAPSQVGHAIAFDMQFAPLAVCAFDVPAGDPPACGFRIPPALPSICPSESFLLIQAPRGPPLAR